jgi:hypothetical protein
VSGVLWLWPTTASDSSAARGVRAVGDLRYTPYYGNTNVEVGAFTVRAEATGAELRRETDPVYPPILVTARRGVYEGKRWAEITLWNGSVANARDGTIVTDGAGYVFLVTERSANGFAGRWGPAGIVATDSGYFCATRL